MNTKYITAFIVTIFISLTPAIAEVFDLPATGTWVKVQDGESIQWSAISSAEPKMRIDLLSYVDKGARITYYLIRSACPDGTVASAVIKAGNKIGVGRDCDGSVVIKDITVLNRVQKLPEEAAELLKR